MGKGKNKKNTKSKTDSNSLKSVNLLFPETMSAEDMQHVIARAILEAEEIKTQNDQAQRQKEHEEFMKTLGRKTYDGIIKNGLNDIKVLWNLIFIKKENIKGYRASVALLKSVNSTFFGLLKWIFLVSSIVSFVFLPFYYFAYKEPLLPWSWYPLFIFFSIIELILFGLFRILETETIKMNDRHFLLDMFTSIISCVSMVIAIVAIVKGV